MKAALLGLLLCALCGTLALPGVQLREATQHMNEQAKAQLLQLFDHVSAKIKPQVDFDFMNMLNSGQCSIPNFPDDQITRLWQNASVSTQCMSALVLKTGSQYANVAAALAQLIGSYKHSTQCHPFAPKLRYADCTDVITTPASNVAAFATACNNNGFHAVGFDLATRLQLSVVLTMDNNRTEYKVGGAVEVDGDFAPVPNECSQSDLNQMANAVHLAYEQFQAAFNLFVPCINNAITQFTQLIHINGISVAFSNIDSAFTITYYPQVDAASGTVSKSVKVGATTLSSAAFPLAVPSLWLVGLAATVLLMGARFI